MKIIGVIFFLVFSIVIFSDEEKELREEIEKSAIQLKMEMEINISGKTIVVLPFYAENEKQGVLLSDIYGYYISGSEKVKVVDRKELGNIMDEIKLQLMGVTKHNDSKKLGELTGGDYLLTGIMENISDKTYINVKIINVSNGETLTSDMISVKNKQIETIGNLEDFFAEKKYPVTAAMRSSLVPGWGQLYNDKPIKASVYGGAFVGGVLTTMYYYNQKHKDDNNTIIDEATNKKIYEEKDENNEKMLTALGFTVTSWAINVIDAYFDAKQ